MSIEEYIAPGKILYINVLMPHDDKYRDKYFVVVCSSPMLLLKINKTGEQTAIGKKHKERQFKIKQSVYTFLKHDSYLDCGTAWYGLLSEDEVKKQLSEDPSRIKGDVITDHRNELIKLTDQSRSISTYHKRLIADSCR